MDLSNLTDKDLQAIAAGKMDQVSDEALEHLAGGGTNSAAPQSAGTDPNKALAAQDTSGVINKVRGYMGKEPIDWNAEKAAGEQAQADQKQRWDSASGGDKLRALLVGSGPAADPNVVQGDVPMVVPGTALPKVASAAAKLGGSVLGRLGMGAAQGAMSSGALDPRTDAGLDDRVNMAKRGAAIGFGTGVAAEGVNAGIGAAGRGWDAIKTARAYKSDPTDLQQKAAEILTEARDAVAKRGTGATDQLKELLTGKKVPVNPTQYSGNPDADPILQKYTQEVPTRGVLGEGSSEVKLPDAPVDMDANDVNNVKRAYQESAKFKPGTVADPVQKAKSAEDALKARELRKALENLPEVGEDVADLNKTSQKSVVTANELKRMARKPVASLSTSSADLRAHLQAADDLAGTNLQDIGNKVAAGKQLAKSPIKQAIPVLLGQGVRGAGQAMSNPGAVNAQTGNLALEQLLNEINKK